MRPAAAAFAALALICLPVASCAQEAANTLTDAEIADGWMLLFDGASLGGWVRYDTGEPTTGWAVEDGLMTHVSRGGDIIYGDRQFVDFELSLEWRVESGGNSGVFYRGELGEEWMYHSAPEMQVLDDAGHRDGQSPLTAAGSVYGLYPAEPGVVHAAGEWNEARVVALGPHVEHWLNGVKLAEYELGSDDWAARVAGSKFVEWPEFATSLRGYIGLQDHGDRVWFRNLKIRELRRP